MEQIIGKLSEIETTAQSIMNDAAQKKKALSAEMERQSKEFDTQLEKHTEEQIQETMFQYSFGLDNCDWTLHKDSYTDDIVFYAGDSVMEAGARNLINNFKNTSHKEPALEHAIRIVDIKVTCDDPELSRNITNALMNISVDQIYQVIGSGEPTVIDYAMAEAVQDVTPGLKKYLMLGALLGALIVCAIVVLRMLTDTTLKTVDDIDRYLHLPVLAAVPYYREMDRK